MRKKLTEIYKGEHFVLTGSSLYRKTDDGTEFIVVNGIEAITNPISGLIPVFTIVDPVK